MMHYAPRKQHRSMFPKPVWVLCHWRSGSYYLTNLLNTTNLFHPQFDEWLRGGYKYDPNHWERPWPPYRQNPDANREWLLENLPPYTKLFHVNYISLGLQNHESHIIKEKYLPGLKFILLRRRDQIGTAVSFYIAQHTDSWLVCNPEEVEAQAAQEVLIDQEQIYDVYQNALGWWTQWDGFLDGHDYLDLYYEDLVSDTQEVERVLKYINVDSEVYYEHTTLKNKHPQVQQIRDILEEGIEKGNVPPPTIPTVPK